MATTYDLTKLDPEGNAENQRNFVRLLLQDTASPWLLADEEIDAIVGEMANLWLSAATLAEIVVSKHRGAKSKQVGKLKIDYLTGWIPRWKARGLSHQAVFVGGISIADKDVLEDDSDWIDPAFARGQHEQQTTDPRKDRAG